MGVRRSATFLPEVAPEQGWDRRATLEALVRKAGERRARARRLRSGVCIALHLLQRATCHKRERAQGRCSRV
jgi:hypothetical protein